MGIQVRTNFHSLWGSYLGKPLFKGIALVRIELLLEGLGQICVLYRLVIVAGVLLSLLAAIVPVIGVPCLVFVDIPVIRGSSVAIGRGVPGVRIPCGLSVSPEPAFEGRTGLAGPNG